MAGRRWVILGVGMAATAGLVLAAVLFGLQGVEVASWIAGVAGVVIGVAAIVLAAPGRKAEPPPQPGPSPSATSRSVATGGEISGIVSTGDNTLNIQQK